MIFPMPMYAFRTPSLCRLKLTDPSKFGMVAITNGHDWQTEKHTMIDRYNPNTILLAPKEFTLCPLNLD